MASPNKLVRLGLAFLFGPILVFSQSIHDSGSIPPLRIDVDLVTVSVAVTDSNDHPVMGLKPGQFQLWEDKVEQPIQYFSSEDVPLSVGIIFDVSGSMETKIAASRDAVATFLRLGNQGDEYFLIEFSDRPRLTQNFTTDITKLQNRIISTVTEGRTAIYDAVYLGLEKLKTAHNPRRALLLITDGGDNHSRYKMSDIREYVKEQAVQIYTIGIGEDTYLDPFRGPVSLGGETIDKLTQVGGGQAFHSESVEELPRICTTIARQLKNEYVLGYKSSNTAKDGKWRKIRVKLSLRPDIQWSSVRFKTGYYAPRQ
jgi:Ca-activated chloride channel family protein